MAIRSFTNSFFQLNSDINFGCVEPIVTCLPVYQSLDLSGWMLATNETVGGVRGAINYYFRLVKSCSEPVTDFTSDDGFILHGTVPSLGEKTETLLTPIDPETGSLPEINLTPYKCGECFFIQVIRLYHPYESEIYEKQLVGCMGCFQKICDPCYTTQLFYRNNEDAFGFDYSIPAFLNIVRLPFYPKEVQFPVEKKVFNLSNGSIKKLSSRIKKEWLVETDYMPKEWHEKLVIALEHDENAFDNTNSNLHSLVMNEGEYQIDWPKFLDYPMAKASFKVKQIPYNNVNSNCK